jgi:SAM-dependent methyltransferase
VAIAWLFMLACAPSAARLTVIPLDGLANWIGEIAMKQHLMNDHRTSEQIKEHYEIEKELANKLRNASKQERRHLYSSLYDELYRRVPLHPQLTRKSSPAESTAAVAYQMRKIRPLLNEETTFLEVGPGDCALSFEVAKFVRQVYAVDVSDEITKSSTHPVNFKLVLSDGTSIPVPTESVDLVFSNQLMEHLHPEDTLEQLENIYNALTPGGLYFCTTPNRLNGPHDVSQYFDEVATGFHLKEYTTSELRNLFKKVGFSSINVSVGAKGIYLNLPAYLVAWYEEYLSKLPYSLRRAVARRLPFRVLLGTTFIGIK